MKVKLRKFCQVGVITGCLIFAANSAMADSKWDNNVNGFRKSENIIVMIPDGCDETVQTVARWYKGEDLEVDKMQTGTVKVHMANSIIPGSAAAATAFATGHKTTVRFLGVGPRTEDLLTGFEPTAAPYAPVASVLEAAQRAGKATGIISTSRVTHATPAAFASHVQDRGMDNEIMEHMVYNNVDVVFGGGARHLIPSGKTYTTSFGAEWGGKRTDGEDLMGVLVDRGYQFIDSKEQMDDITSHKVWGLFDDSHMQPDMDRQHFAVHEPSLAEMVEKAIEILSQDPDGFLLMVEGSQVDWAGHNNDPIYMVTDFIAFDDAVKVANDFAEENGRTTVMAYPDHNTGGMKIGHYNTVVGYTETLMEDLVDPLKGMTMSANGVVKMMEDESDDGELKKSVSENWDIVLSVADVEEIRELEVGLSLSYALARVVSKNYTVIGWTTHGHTGETVPLWMTGNTAPTRVIDNTELAYIAADAINVDLKKTTENLYVDLDTITQDYEIDYSVNPVLRVNGAELPISKDYMINKKGSTIMLPGVTVLATQATDDDPDDDKIYISKKALGKLGLR